MLSEAVKEALRSFKRAPGIYAYFAVLSALFCLLSVLAGLGIIILLFFMFSVLNYPFFSLVGFTATMIIALFVFWLMSGVHGATINYYGNLLNGKKYGLQDGFVKFVDYSVNNASEFFLVGLVRLIVAAIPTAIIYLLYTLLQQYNVPFIDVFLVIIGLGMVFIVYFIFFPVFISLAIYGTGIRRAFGNAFKVFSRAHVMALALYFGYSVIWILNLIPLINLFTLFVAYPISYASLIALFKRAAR